MLQSRLKEIMGAVLGIDPEAIDENVSVESVAAWDSLHHMNLVLALEDEFGVRLPEDKIAELTSLPALRDELDRLTSARPAS